MLKNYFKIAWRNFAKDKLSTSINIGGLTIGLAIAVLLLMVIKDDLSFNKFQPKLDRIFLMMKHDDNGGQITTFKSTSGALAVELKNLPEINHIGRMTYNAQFLIGSGDKSLYENGFYADPDIFRILQFEKLHGDPVAALQSGSSVVLSQKAAKKLFDTDDAVGKTLRLNNNESLTVGAVLKDIPMNSSVRFDMAIPFSQFERANADYAVNWGQHFLQTWVELKPGIPLAGFNQKIDKIYKERTENTKSELFAYPLARYHLWGEFTNGKPAGGRGDVMTIMGVIGFFILFIACINFMNLATARSEKRSKEVGVRKVMGAERKSLIFQFLCEAILMTIPALILAVSLVSVVLPPVNLFIRKDMHFDFLDPQIWGILLALGLITGLIAGSYPAFYLSKFKPVKVLKGNTGSAKGSPLLRRILVTTQFAVSVFLIIASIVVFRQLKHTQDRPIGYDNENLIEIPVRGDVAQRYDVLKNNLLRISGVKSVSAGTANMVQFGGQTDGFTWPGKTPEQNFLIGVTDAHYDWIKTGGLTLVEGRDFSPDFGTDSLGVLLNEAAVKKMQLKSPLVGTPISDRRVIGVFRDFVYNSPERAPQPLVVQLGKQNLNHIFIRLENKAGWKNTLNSIESIFKATNPGYPFEFHFAKANYEERFKGIEAASNATSMVSILAIIISVLGLFALAAFVAERRAKDISIRKVLGAGLQTLLFSLSKDFLKPVLLGFIIATPLAGFVMNKVLTKLDYHISLSWWMFALAGLIVLLIALITVGYQTLKAANANPLKALRTE